MKPLAHISSDDFDDPLTTVEGDEEAHEEDLWFLPGPIEEEPDYLPPGPRAEPPEPAVIDEWGRAEGAHAARLAKVAGRLGALDDRLLRGPEGWRHRLALIEAVNERSKLTLLQHLILTRLSDDKAPRRAALI